jgi:UDP-sulfoquinovose synthase
MLYPVPSLLERAKIWHKITGKEIKVIVGDLNEPDLMRGLFNGKIKYNWSLNNKFTGIPETVVHYAEQPSAPYSLIDYKHADITLINNLRVTNNLMWALKDYAPETHVVKLGTMGEYGTPNIDIEEGWIEIEHKKRKDKFLFPRQGSSIYHTTKIMDTDLFWFGVRIWGLKVTDLMQGPVYGIETEETKIDESLNTIFNYDEVFGTVINRFIVQAVSGYPLTVYGKGGQTRGYLNIKDTLQCVYKSALSPAKAGELRIFNQIVETFSVKDLAKKIFKVGNERDHNVKIDHIENPRKESESHYYNPVYQGLLDIGVKPNFLTDEVVNSIFKIVEKYSKNIRKDVIFRGIKW